MTYSMMCKWTYTRKLTTNLAHMEFRLAAYYSSDSFSYYDERGKKKKEKQFFSELNVIKRNYNNFLFLFLLAVWSENSQK